jgi:ubiquinone/menaquinone biosynthesis C-methylase UbiE
MTSVSNKFKEMYDSHYSDSLEEWRRIGAVGKVQNIIDITKGLHFNSLVDIGAGDGNVLSLLSEKKMAKKFTAVEISDSAIEQIKKKSILEVTEIKQFDGYNLPFEDNAFDLAVCSHVIEHVEFPRKLLREIKRISKHQVFEIPIDFSFRLDKKFEHFNSYGHINIYTPALFNFLLYTEGYEIVKHKNAFFRNEVYRFQYKGKLLKRIVAQAKTFVRKSIPFLAKIKPDTYIVLTK